MVTYAQLWTASPPAWAAVAAALRHRARRLADRAADVALLARRLGAAWTGAAGRAAQRRVAELRSGATAQVAPLIAADQALAEFAAGLVRAKAVLAAAVEATHGTAVTVDGDGRVSVTGTGGGPLAGRTAAGIRSALELAALADADAAARLAELRVPVAPAPPGWTPSPGAAAVTVAAWWAGLTQPERWWLLAHRPELIGPLDGVPVAVRDQANRSVAGRLPGDDAWWDRAEPPRAYLLRLDPAAGRAVVALGDPDRADHVLVHVPGAGSGLETLDRDLARVEQVLGRAATVTPGAAVAGVLWLDYGAPAGPAAALAGSAHAAAPALDRFVDGLRATGAGHVTVLGHSYGSLVVGVTARDHGLAADDTVFVGSPGVGVDRVEELRLPAAHVWSTTARTDPIQLVAPSLVQAGRDLALGAVVPGYAVPAALAPDADLWHGRNPATADFGGQVFASNPHAPLATAHNAYWDRDNVALDTIARITIGIGSGS